MSPISWHQTHDAAILVITIGRYAHTENDDAGAQQTTRASNHEENTRQELAFAPYGAREQIMLIREHEPPPPGQEGGFGLTKTRTYCVRLRPD